MWNLKQFLNQPQVPNKDDLKVDISAQDWLKSNLDIDVAHFKSKIKALPLLKMSATSRPLSATSSALRPKFQTGHLSTNYKNYDQQSKYSRPISEYSVR